MDNTAKVALSFGTGIVAGRILGNGAWLLAAGALVLFFANSAEAQEVAKKGYTTAKNIAAKK
jgi:hypothetical protein